MIADIVMHEKLKMTSGGYLSISKKKGKEKKKISSQHQRIQ